MEKFALSGYSRHYATPLPPATTRPPSRRSPRSPRRSIRASRKAFFTRPPPAVTKPASTRVRRPLRRSKLLQPLRSKGRFEGPPFLLCEPSRSQAKVGAERHATGQSATCTQHLLRFSFVAGLCQATMRIERTVKP